MAAGFSQHFKCDICGTTCTNNGHELLPGAMYDRWNCPANWQWVGRKLVCDKHEVVIDPPEKTDKHTFVVLPREYQFNLKEFRDLFSGRTANISVGVYNICIKPPTDWMYP